MPDTPSITIVKEFPYRGVPEQWSNTYHFSGDTPESPGQWKGLADAIWNLERTILDDVVKIYAAYGYEAGNEVSVWQHNYFDTPGSQTTGTLTGGHDVPGDCAVWVRWKTDERNSKGRPIYLRKYFHGVTGSDSDAVTGAAQTAMTNYGNAMISGGLFGGIRVCGPQGAVAGEVKVSTFYTTRTLKRRGKRP